MAIPQDPIQFLTVAEAHAIDGAMLSTMEKFMTRIAISSMRIINKIADDLHVQTEELTVSAIVEWIERDSQIFKTQGREAAFLQWSSSHPDLDFEDTREDEVTSARLSSHEKFLTRMVISARITLVAIAKDCNTHIKDLTINQVIDWMRGKPNS